MEISVKNLRKKTPQERQWRCSHVFIEDFEQSSFYTVSKAVLLLTYMWPNAFHLDIHTLPLYFSSRNSVEIIFEFKVIIFLVTQTAIAFYQSTSMVGILPKMAMTSAVNYFRRKLINCRLNIYSKFIFSP